VNRQVVREAIKRLVHLGLVHCGQGAANRVLDWRHSGSFELVGLLAMRSQSGREELDQMLARSLLEVRRTFGTDIARLCALRCDGALVDELSGLVEAIPSAGSPLNRMVAKWAFWDKMVDGADNLCYRLMFNSIRTALPKATVLMSHYSERVPADIDGYRSLVAAIGSGDAAAAAADAERLLEIEATEMARVVGMFDNAVVVPIPSA
jgi:GntR family transcriptional regulator, transcriptional repressor for pyruvate dehydrogenase complex